MVTTKDKTSTRDQTVDRYFRAIDAALEGLEAYLREEDSPLYHHELIGRILTGYIDRLSHSFRAWENRLSFSERFRINQAESGYPLFRNVLAPKPQNPVRSLYSPLG